MNTNFQHTESQMHRAFNVSDEQRNYIMHNIIFETINTYIQVFRLYDDWDDAPHEMTANTALIEKIAKRLEDPAELLYMVYTFNAAREGLDDMLKSLLSNKKTDDDIDTINSHEGDMKQILKAVITKAKLIPVRSMFSQVKKANGLFESYWSMITNDGKDTTIDDLLNNALKG
jgi:hypothetical protein